MEPFNCLSLEDIFEELFVRKEKFQRRGIKVNELDGREEPQWHSAEGAQHLSGTCRC